MDRRIEQVGTRPDCIDLTTQSLIQSNQPFASLARKTKIKIKKYNFMTVLLFFYCHKAFTCLCHKVVVF